MLSSEASITISPTVAAPTSSGIGIRTTPRALPLTTENDVHREYQEVPASPLVHLEIPTYDVAIEHEWRVAPALTLTPSYSYMIQPDRTVEVYNSNTRAYSPVETNRSTANNAQLVGTYQLDEQQSLFAGVSQKTRFPHDQGAFLRWHGQRGAESGSRSRDRLALRGGIRAEGRDLGHQGRPVSKPVTRCDSERESGAYHL